MKKVVFNGSREKRIVFDGKNVNYGLIPNLETVKVLKESEKRINVHEVKNVNKLFKELEKDENGNTC